MTHTVRLPHDVSSAAAARHRVSAEMTSQQVGARVVDEVALVVSELVANSVRHANPLPGGEVEVTWDVHGDAVELAVTDGGGEDPPRARMATPDEVSGRGLTIVARLAARWGVHDTPAGTTVWVVIPVRGTPPVSTA